MDNSNNKSNSNSKRKNHSSCCLFQNGKNLNIIAASLSNAISDEFTVEELGVLAIFFTILGDAIATIVAVDTLCKKNSEGDDSSISGEEALLFRRL